MNLKTDLSTSLVISTCESNKYIILYRYTEKGTATCGTGVDPGRKKWGVVGRDGGPHRGPTAQGSGARPPGVQGGGAPRKILVKTPF